MATATIQSLWTFIQSMHLSTQNRKWLAERLLEDDVVPKTHLSIDSKKFPRINLSEPLSDDVISMSCSDVASDFDYNAERDKMYREWSR